MNLIECANLPSARRGLPPALTQNIAVVEGLAKKKTAD
jgi:hypothetical protein